MRRLADPILIALALLLVTGACEGPSEPGEPAWGQPVEEPAPPAPGPIDTPERAGELHSEGLRFILARLRAEGEGSGGLAEGAIEPVMAIACRDFLELAAVPGRPCTDLGRMLERGRRGEPPYQIPSSAQVGGLTLGPSQQAWNLLSAIQGAWDQTQEPWAFAWAIAGIEAQARASLSGDELELVLSVAAVALDSARYWWEELPGWMELSSGCTLVLGTCKPWYLEHEPTWLAPGLDAGRSWNLCKWAHAPEWCATGWRVVGSDIGGAIGGGIHALIFKAVIPQGAAAAGLVSSTAAIGMELFRTMSDPSW